MDFTGRRWLYDKLEHVLEQSSNHGSLIIGNPGSGKSAFVSNLLCSTTSSPTIRGRILAYHFCMHFNKATQEGAKFVRNLANMIAWKIDQYREIILKNSFYRRVLYKDCPQYPEWCFEQGILTPLKKFHPKPTVPWYIVIDALDECFSDKAEVVNILKSKVSRFPQWLKLIVTSRNVNSIIAGLDDLQRIELRLHDKRNLEDIDTYITMKLFPLRETIVQTIKTYLAITDNDRPTQKIISFLAEKGQGNFLFVKVVLDMWLASKDLQSLKWETFPKTLDSTYQLYFERKYETPESFQSLRQIFEVLVATYRPLTVHEMYAMFRIDKPDLDLEYEFLPKLDQVSLFLWYGSGDGLIRIHHSSLSEWLTSMKNKGKVFYIKKQLGHNRLAKYYLQKTRKNRLPLTPNDAFHLASHIVAGGSDTILVQQFLELPSEQINTTDPFTQSNALHCSSSSFDANVTMLIMRHFSDVDSLDSNHRTPSFIAATRGHVNTLKALFKRGADLHHTTTYLASHLSNSHDPVIECKVKKCVYSLLHTAAQEGNVDAVKFLIEQNVSISRPTGTNNTAIQLAAAHGHLETVRALSKAGGVLDGTTLHHAAAGGHKDVVQYLLQEGVEDSCIFNSPSSVPSIQDDQESNTFDINIFDNHHIHLQETALHAAVIKGHLSVIQLLIKDLKKSAVNCENSAGRQPHHEAVHLNKYNELKVLLASGANATVPCHAGMFSSTQFEPSASGKLKENKCPCGFSPLHIAAMYGYHSIAKLLISYKADVNAGDCSGTTPLHVASCQGMSALIYLLVNSGADVNARSLNHSTPLHSAAVCFSKGVFRPLFDLGCNHLATDSERMTALHYLVKEVNITSSEYLVDLYVNKPIDWMKNPKSASFLESNNKLSMRYPWLTALVELIDTFVSSKRAIKTSFLDMLDTRNQSAFDKLEEKMDVPSLVVGIHIRRLPLVLILSPFLFAYDVTQVERFHLPPLNNPYEPPSFSKALSKFISKKVSSLFTNFNCSSLTKVVRLSYVHAANTVLQAGVDVNCHDEGIGLSPLLVYLRTGGRHMSKVLVKHSVEVKIKCQEPFEFSHFHLVSYHKLHYLHYFHEFLQGKVNWQKYLQEKNAMFDYFFDVYEEQNNNGTIRIGDGPLTEAISLHPKGTKVIDECFDKEGYNAFQRAAQGANLVAIQKFLSWGANPWLEAADGFSPLWLSVLYAVKYRPFLNLQRPSVLTALEVEMASFAASAILDHILTKGTFDVGCNESLSELTLYHIAASRGMWQFVTHLLSSNLVTGINVNCPNKDGITPMYLAKVVGGNSCQRPNPWCNVIKVIKSFGGNLQYPTLEGEYFLIFNVFFGMNPSSLILELTEQEVRVLQEDCAGDECQEYKSRNVDLYSTSYQVDEIHNDYQRKVSGCSAEDCPAEIKTNLPHFTTVLLILNYQLSGKVTFFNVRNDFIAFLDREIRRIKDLLYITTRPHSEVVCGKGCEQANGRSNTIDMCSFSGQSNLETLLHSFYRTYKNNYTLALAHSDEVTAFLPHKEKLTVYIFQKMNVALRSYNTMLKCDWQSVAIKYIQLSFLVRTLNYWKQVVRETSVIPSVSDFLSERMNVILQSSKESRKLALKLASRQPVESFNYLKVLRFERPPFWRETFYGIPGTFGRG